MFYTIIPCQAMDKVKTSRRFFLSRQSKKKFSLVRDLTVLCRAFTCYVPNVRTTHIIIFYTEYHVKYFMSKYNFCQIMDTKS